MSAARVLVVGAMAAAAAIALQERRSLAVRRRISWAPGGGTFHDGVLHARVLGEGPAAVMLLHGLGGSNAYWGSAYDSLATAGRLVVPDLLGFGASPRPDVGYSTDDHVTALTELLEDVGVTGQIVVGAHSLGTLLAVALAERHPDLVAGVVAFCPPLYADETSARERVASLGWMEAQLVRDGPWAKALCEWVCDHREAAARFASLVRPGLPARIRQDGVQHNWESYSQTFRHVLAAADGSRGLASLHIPVELVAGSDDPIVDLAHLRRLAADLAHVSLAVRDGADHDLPLTDPAGAVAAVETMRRRVLGSVTRDSYADAPSRRAQAASHVRQVSAQILQ